MRLRKLSITILFVVAGYLWAQQIELPQNPLDGRLVFEEKGCIECHAIGGYGGTAGPDLSREEYHGSTLELASIIWNHTPQMNRKYRQLRMERPHLTQTEMSDLFGFLYYLRYLGEPGGVAKGKRLMESKGCVTCHTVAGKGGTVGPNLDGIQQYASPLYMVQAMWNHGPAMRDQIKKTGMNYPNLSSQNIVDIAAYIRQATTGSVEIRMSPGNPAKGKELFKEKHCASCHLGEGRAKRIAPHLSRIELKKGVTEIASQMWNHGPVMMEFMDRESIEWPGFQGNEMADLIAYIYFLGFEDEPGDDQAGLKVFQSKGCADCHKKAGGKALDLSTVKQFKSPIRMIQLMWNHAVEMEDLLIVQNKEWPKLTTKEMRDLYAYLREVTQE